VYKGRIMRASRRLLLIVAGYTALGLFIAVANSLTYMTTGSPANWQISIERSLAEWYLWALVTPAILWLAERRPITRRTLVVNGSIHLAAMLVVGIAKALADQYVRRLLFGRAGYMLLSSLAANFLLYWAIVAIAHGIAYYRTGRDRELRASQLEARLAETRLQLLRMQLQPHFLFNTLNTISELVHEAPETADRMISRLSQLLRETLRSGDEPFVSLTRELELLDSYIDIQRTRFGDRLHVAVDAQADALTAAVPSLLLQPLVENSIRHGLARTGSGRIEIRARRDGSNLLLQVQDDGKGLTTGPEREGIGLGNTRARLDTLFGSAFTLDVTNAESGGTLVSIAVPYRELEEV
jgi:two-component system LytT family sensor kinase